MKQTLRGALVIVAAAATLGSANRSSAIERYRSSILPSGPGGGVAKAIYSCNPGGGLLGVVGEVHNDGEIYGALWQRTQNGWRLRRLTANGVQSTANAVVCRHRQTAGGVTHNPLIVGSLTGMDGRTVAVGFDIDAAPNGDLHMAIRMLDGPGSEATGAIVDYIDEDCLIVGAREMPDGREEARLYSLDVNTGNVLRMSLPTGPGETSEADAIAQLPNGDLRIVGCKTQAGSDMEIGCEWRGTPATGFTSQTLPHNDGILTHHVYGMSETGNYAVGAQFFGDGSVRPIGWATAPSPLTDFGLVDLNAGLWPPSTLDVRFSAVNSRGRTVGYDMGDTGTHEIGRIMDINRPVEEQRTFPFSHIVSPRDAASGLPTGLRAIGEDGTICGTAFFDFDGDGDVEGAAFVAIPDATYQMPDLLTLVNGYLAADLDQATRSTYWDDTDVVHLLTKEGSGTLILDGKFFQPGPEIHGNLFEVVSHVDGMPKDRVSQMCCLWNFDESRWTFLAKDVLKGGHDQRNLYALPTNLGPHVSPTGEMRFRIVWGDGGVPTESGFGVSVNAITLRSR
jgi:hypothetical protein